MADDIATLVFDIDSSRARTAATDLAKLQDAATRVSAEFAKGDAAIRRTNGQFASSVEVVGKYGAEVRSLTAEFNPALNAVYRFQEAETRLNRAIALGVISANQKDAALERLRVQYAAAAVGSERLGNRVGNATYQIQNAGYQVGDFFVQIASGQNAIMALSQQLPQLLGSFGAIGAVAGAGTAILGALWLIYGAGETAAEKLSKSLDSVAESIATIGAANKALSLDGIDELGAKYGEVTAQVRELVATQRELARGVAANELKAALDGLFQTSDNSLLQSIYQADTFIERTRNLASELGVTQAQARSLYTSLQQAYAAEGIDDQVAALTRLRERANEILLTNDKLTKEQAEFLQNVIDSEDAARQLVATSGGLPDTFDVAARAASRIVDELTKATAEAAKLARGAISDVRFAQIELDFRTDKVAKAGAIAAAKFDEAVENKGIDQGLFNRLRNQAIEGAKEAARISEEVDRLNKADRDAERAGKAGDKKAAAELRAAEKGFQSLRELVEKESMFQVAEYEKNQTRLDEALAKRLLSEQQYESLRAQLKTLYFGSETEQAALQYAMDLEQLNLFHQQKLLSEEQYLMRLRELQSSYYSEAIGIDQNATSQKLSQISSDFAQMNQLAGGGYAKLLKAQQTFAASAAFINAYLAASQALADPTVGFWGKFAAYAKVLAAGLGAVNAIKGGGSGGSSSRASATSSAANASAEPVRNILVNIDGPDWLQDIVGSVITQITEQSKDGRVIIANNR